METIKEKIERMKATADILLSNDKPVYVKDTSDTYYFGHILLIGDDTLTVQCFGPGLRKGMKVTLYWPLIIKLVEYREEA